MKRPGTARWLAMRHAIERLSGWFHRVGVYAVLPLLILLVTADVLMRYLGGGSIRGATEVAQLLLLVVFFASLPWCTTAHGHVYMEFVHERLGGTARRAADGLAAIAGLAFAAALAWQTARKTVEMFRLGEGAEMVDLPYWPFAAVVTASGVLMALAFGLQLLQVLAGAALDRRPGDGGE